MNYEYCSGLCISFSFHSAAVVKHLDQKQPGKRRNLSGLYFQVSSRCGRKLGQELKQEQEAEATKECYLWIYLGFHLVSFLM